MRKAKIIPMQVGFIAVFHPPPCSAHLGTVAVRGGQPFLGFIEQGFDDAGPTRLHRLEGEAYSDVEIVVKRLPVRGLRPKHSMSISPFEPCSSRGG
jgi:hypothetical protein